MYTAQKLLEIFSLLRLFKYLRMQKSFFMCTTWGNTSYSVYTTVYKGGENNLCKLLHVSALTRIPHTTNTAHILVTGATPPPPPPGSLTPPPPPHRLNTFVEGSF